MEVKRIILAENFGYTKQEIDFLNSTVKNVEEDWFSIGFNDIVLNLGEIPENINFFDIISGKILVGRVKSNYEGLKDYITDCFNPAFYHEDLYDLNVRIHPEQFIFRRETFKDFDSSFGKYFLHEYLYRATEQMLPTYLADSVIGYHGFTDLIPYDKVWYKKKMEEKYDS